MLVRWTGLTDILPPSWFRPSHKAHAELVEQFGLLRGCLFASWGMLRVLSDGRVRGEIGAVVVAAVGSVELGLDCGIPGGVRDCRRRPTGHDDEKELSVEVGCAGDD
ncbi:uncharacterized protein LAJ45_10739 [Morchella importuna]|uniref:uncharacterized protein n=1 Tax=Morchella importuna TaxID=1174673 RepID=UPI001E8CB761|nr:uncharacterized protein LAJ45_10739 [Morchella importuna]KAH8145302.1 hypothetical protein LAJ45_10739 [Morchella importuna]